MRILTTATLTFFVFLMHAKPTNTAFEIVGIGILSDSCSGDRDQKFACSEALVNRYLLSNINWSTMDTVLKGKQQIELKYDVTEKGKLSNLAVESENIALSKSFYKELESWPKEFKYIREDGMKIVGRYSSFFSFYF